jgi:hypothetical protein
MKKKFLSLVAAIGGLPSYLFIGDTMCDKVKKIKPA